MGFVRRNFSASWDESRFAMAKRMGATTYQLDSSHVPMLSQPERVIDVIRAVAKAASGATWPHEIECSVRRC